MSGLFLVRLNKECRFALQLCNLKTSLYTIFLFDKIITESTAYRKYLNGRLLLFNLYLPHGQKYRKKEVENATGIFKNVNLA